MNLRESTTVFIGFMQWSRLCGVKTHYPRLIIIIIISCSWGSDPLLRLPANMEDFCLWTVGFSFHATPTLRQAHRFDYRVCDPCNFSNIRTLSVFQPDSSTVCHTSYICIHKYWNNDSISSISSYWRSFNSADQEWRHDSISAWPCGSLLSLCFSLDVCHTITGRILSFLRPWGSQRSCEDAGLIYYITQEINVLGVILYKHLLAVTGS